MRFAYDRANLYNLTVIKESTDWMKQGMISKEQLGKIRECYPCTFYHPNLIIRLLLFVVSLMGISGVTGILAIAVIESSVTTISIAAIIYGLGSFMVLENLFIKSNRHFKSGINEALLYHSIGFTLGGISGLLEFSTLGIFTFGIIIFSFAAIRYIDLISTLCAVVCVGGLLFWQLFELGGLFQSIIPIVLSLAFIVIYIVNKKAKSKVNLRWWQNNFILIDYLSLIVIYLSVNYLVVRELSVELLGMELGEGQDIPLAYVFYGLTLVMPVAYLYFGIRQRDIALIRVSLLVFAFAAFTFKHYFIYWENEITLTVAGFLMIGIAIYALNYLKVIRSGITREIIKGNKWFDPNVEAFVVSQTLGGNEIVEDDSFKGQGGGFGGGGASGEF